MRTSSLLFLLSSAILAVQSLPIPEPDLFSNNPVLQARTIPPGKPAARGSAQTTPKKSTTPPVAPAAKPASKASTQKPLKGSPAAAASCPMRKGGAKSVHRRSILEKRAPGKFTSSNAPDSITIKLGGVEYALNKFGSQGQRGLTYQVSGGSHNGAFAKQTSLPRKLPILQRYVSCVGIIWAPRVRETRQESDDVLKVGLTLASGQDENTCNEIQATWLIVKEVHGKKFMNTPAYQAAKGDHAKCEEVLGRALKLMKAKLIAMHTDHGINHNDASHDNCLFDDEVSKVEFIDFGEATTAIPDDKGLKRILLGQFPPDQICPK